MPKILIAALFVLGLSSAAMSQDPVQVDPKHYKVEFENAQVRVLRVKYGPHEKSVMHKHPNLVAIFMTDGNVRFTFPNGPSQDAAVKAGETMWNPGVVHLPENTGDQPFEVILVELKGNSRAHHTRLRAHHR